MRLEHRRKISIALVIHSLDGRDLEIAPTVLFSGRGLRHTECAYYFMIPELSRIIPKISALFGKSPDSLHVAPIRHGSVERESVWRVTVDGRNYALKQHIAASLIGDSAFTPFEVESAVLSTLHDAGCSVPTIVWRSDADFCLLLDWRGESTLDDLAQAAPLGSLKRSDNECSR